VNKIEIRNLLEMKKLMWLFNCRYKFDNKIKFFIHDTHNFCKIEKKVNLSQLEMFIFILTYAPNLTVQGIHKRMVRFQ
jgi:hypothetical protein